MVTKKRLLISFILVMLISACSLPGGMPTSLPVQPAAVQSQNSSDYFPLKKGAYWVYQGPVRWIKAGSTDVLEEEITWKMEVVQVIHRNDITGYEVQGAPWDLIWYQPGKEQSKHGFIQMGGKIYSVPLETVLRLLNEGDDLANLVTENNVFLDLPLEKGKKFCDPASLARSDNMYCSIVGESTPFDAGHIKGVAPSTALLEYPIVYQTMPDVSWTYFVPGVGISHYFYHHNGTVSEVDVHLIEYSPRE